VRPERHVQRMSGTIELRFLLPPAGRAAKVLAASTSRYAAWTSRAVTTTRATALTAERILPLRPRWTPVSGQYGDGGREGQCRKRAAQAHCLVATEACLIRVGVQVPWLGLQGLTIHRAPKSQRCSHKGRPRSKREGPARRISTGRKEWWKVRKPSAARDPCHLQT